MTCDSEFLRAVDGPVAAPYLYSFAESPQGEVRNGSQEAWSRPQESLPLLHEGRLPASRLRGLQRRPRPEEDVHQPGQALQPQAQRQLRRVSTRRQGRDQTGPLYGPAAVRRRV